MTTVEIVNITFLIDYVGFLIVDFDMHTRTLYILNKTRGTFGHKKVFRFCTL